MQSQRKLKLGDDGELIEAFEVLEDADLRRMKPKPEKAERQYPKFFLMIFLAAITLFVMSYLVVSAIVVPMGVK